MKKLLYCLGALLLTSCATSRLYYWGSDAFSDNGTSKYESLAYKNYDQQTPKSICELLCLYDDMTSHPGGKRNVVPPGICAEYGFLLLQPDIASIFEQNATKKQLKTFQSDDLSALFFEKGKEMLSKEMDLYPESKKFIEPLLKRITQ